MKTNPPYQAVVFDLFGTLVEDVQEPIYHRMASKLGLPSNTFREHWISDYPSRAKGAHTFRQSIENMCEKIGLTATPEVVDEVAEIRTKEVRRSLAKMRPGVMQLFSALARTNLRKGLLSNASPEVPEHWPSCPIESYFDTVVFSCQVKLMKPDPEIFRLVCKRLDAEPEDCLYIGNGGDNELAGAASVGMTPVQVRTAAPNLPGAKHVIDSFAQLPELLGLVGRPGS